MNHPNPKKHLYISLAKSVIRIAGGILLTTICVPAGIALILAEVLGIIEELV